MDGMSELETAMERTNCQAIIDAMKSPSYVQNLMAESGMSGRGKPIVILRMPKSESRA